MDIRRPRVHLPGLLHGLQRRRQVSLLQRPLPDAICFDDRVRGVDVDWRGGVAHPEQYRQWSRTLAPRDRGRCGPPAGDEGRCDRKGGRRTRRLGRSPRRADRPAGPVAEYPAGDQSHQYDGQDHKENTAQHRIFPDDPQAAFLGDILQRDVPFAPHRRNRRQGHRRRGHPQQHQPLRRRGVPWIQAQHHLQAVRPFLDRIHDGAHPQPVFRIGLVRSQQAGEQVACPVALPLAHCVDCLLEHHIFCHHPNPVFRQTRLFC